MTHEHLLGRTSNFQIRESCPHTLSRQSSDRYRPSQTDPTRPPLSSRYYSSWNRRPSTRLAQQEINANAYIYPPISGAESPDTDSTPPPDDVYPSSYIQQANELSARQPAPPSPAGYRITASCEDPSGDEEEPTSPTILLDRQQRRYRVDESSTSEDDEEPRTLRYHRQRCVPRRIEWIDKELESEGKVSSNEVLPYAKFFIEKRKHVVSLKFDPPMYVAAA